MTPRIIILALVAPTIRGGPDSANDDALPGRSSGTRSALSDTAMRDYDEEDPKKPQPVQVLKKRSNPAEASEAVPCRKDDDRDHHRHVV